MINDLIDLSNVPFLKIKTRLSISSYNHILHNVTARRTLCHFSRAVVGVFLPGDGQYKRTFSQFCSFFLYSSNFSSISSIFFLLSSRWASRSPEKVLATPLFTSPIVVRPVLEAVISFKVVFAACRALSNQVKR